MKAAIRILTAIAIGISLNLFASEQEGDIPEAPPLEEGYVPGFVYPEHFMTAMLRVDELMDQVGQANSDVQAANNKKDALAGWVRGLNFLQEASAIACDEIWQKSIKSSVAFQVIHEYKEMKGFCDLINEKMVQYQAAIDELNAQSASLNPEEEGGIPKAQLSEEELLAAQTEFSQAVDPLMDQMEVLTSELDELAKYRETLKARFVSAKSKDERQDIISKLNEVNSDENEMYEERIRLITQIVEANEKRIAFIRGTAHASEIPDLEQIVKNFSEMRAALVDKIKERKAEMKKEMNKLQHEVDEMLENPYEED